KRSSTRTRNEGRGRTRLVHDSDARPMLEVETLHEPNPLTPSLSPTGGEGARRAGEGDSAWFMVPMHAQKRKEALHEPADEVTACRRFPSALPIVLMKRTTLLSLAGFLIVATSRVAMCAEGEHDFGKWEKEIAAYEQMDRTNPPPKGALLFIGSSTI